MNSRAWDRLRRDLDELVGARLDVATFCAEAGPQLARVVPSCAGAAESPTWYAIDPDSILVTGVYGRECEIDTAAQMRWEYVAQRLSVMAAVYGLSSREQQVVQLVVKGHATQRIARRTGVSPYPVQEHLRRIFAKVGAASRGELVASLFFDRGE